MVESQAPVLDRAHVEQSHYDAQRKTWIKPVYIKSTAAGAENIDIPLPQYKRVSRTIAEIVPEECRQFCWKDCAIYCNTGMSGLDHLEILDFVYQEWFPHRDRGKDVSLGSFFGKFMRFIPPVEIAELVSFHSRLCEKLPTLQADVLEQEALPFQPEYGQPREQGLYRLRETFSTLSVVMDHKSWREKGVLLVCKDEETAAAHGLTEAAGSASRQERFVVDTGSPACVFRVTLKRAMQAVVFLDEDRRKKRKEYNMAFDESYGSGAES